MRYRVDAETVDSHIQPLPSDRLHTLPQDRIRPV